MKGARSRMYVIREEVLLDGGDGEGSGGGGGMDVNEGTRMVDTDNEGGGATYG